MTNAARPLPRLSKLGIRHLLNIVLDHLIVRLGSITATGLRRIGREPAAVTVEATTLRVRLWRARRHVASIVKRYGDHYGVMHKLNDDETIAFVMAREFIANTELQLKPVPVRTSVGFSYELTPEKYAELQKLRGPK